MVFKFSFLNVLFLYIIMKNYRSTFFHHVFLTFFGILRYVSCSPDQATKSKFRISLGWFASNQSDLWNWDFKIWISLSYPMNSLHIPKNGTRNTAKLGICPTAGLALHKNYKNWTRQVFNKVQILWQGHKIWKILAPILEITC